MIPITILVLSYDDNKEYSDLMRAQQETWDSINEPMVKTFYYTGGGTEENKVLVKQVHHWSMQYGYPCSDNYYEMHWKFKLCLQHLLHWPIPTMVFRTNSSSYINKKELVKFAATLPDKKCYAGWAGRDFISGAGFFISHDVQKLLCDAMDKDNRVEEDVYIGRLLQQHDIPMIDDKSRFDVQWMGQTPPLDRYHYRFKTEDRYEDAINMRKLHQLIKEKNNV